MNSPFEVKGTIDIVYKIQHMLKFSQGDGLNIINTYVLMKKKVFVILSVFFKSLKHPS